MAVVMSLAILYEHPEWFQLLFAELGRRGIPFEEIHADQLMFDPETRAFPDLVVNRMSPSAWKRGHANGIFTVRDYLGISKRTASASSMGHPPTTSRFRSRGSWICFASWAWDIREPG